MTVSRVASATAALAIGGLSVFGLATSALAAPGDNCPNPAGKYPPGQCHTSPGQIGDTTPEPGKSENVHSEGWQPGSKGKMYTQSAPIFVGNFTADSNGVVNTTITIPLALANEVGAHQLILQGIGPNGAPLTQVSKFTVTAANAKAALAASKGANPGTKTGNGGSTKTSVGVVQLPRTGTEIAAVSAVGIALVGAGSIAIYGGRRKRTAA